MRMKAVMLLPVLALAACSDSMEPPCVEEAVEFTQLSTSSRATNLQKEGWDCQFLFARRDPIFGIAVLETWNCTRCS